MKAQSEVLNFILMFLILIIMIFAAYFWALPIFEDSNDTAKKNIAEHFIRELDSKIQRIAKFGGYETIDYNLDGILQIKENATDRWIEYKTLYKPKFTEKWFYLSGNETFEVGQTDTKSIIKERKKGNNLYIELWYRKTGNTKIEIIPTQKIVTRHIKIEKLKTIAENGINKILVKIDFE